MFKMTVGVLMAAGFAVAQGQGFQKSAPKAPLPVSPYEPEKKGSGDGREPAIPKPFTGESPATEGRWEIRASDITLAKTFERWASAAGHKVKWDASRNFLIGASDSYVGTFEGALQHVLSSPGIRYSDYPLEACIYANNPPLVRITRQGEQSRECISAQQ